MKIKNKKDIGLITENCRLMGIILDELQAMVRPGITTWDIDQAAEEKILAVGGKPSFKGYRIRSSDPAFPSTICASVNEELVHGIARKDKVLKKGDIVSIDIGMIWPAGKKGVRGVFSDTAITVPVGPIAPATKKLLDVTRIALEKGIAAAEAGASIAAIGKAVQAYVKSEGSYGIVRDLVGHGVGHAVHEDPHIPNYYDPGLESVKLEPGMVIAIEPMISMNSEYRVHTKEDGWTIEMIDKALCAHFEHTVVITKKGPVVVTRRPSELASL